MTHKLNSNSIPDGRKQVSQDQSRGFFYLPHRVVKKLFSQYCKSGYKTNSHCLFGIFSLKMGCIRGDIVWNYGMLTSIYEGA
jgi:hypothetical protein